MGVSYQAVSNWERGNTMPDIAKIPDLARELGLEITELLGGEEGKAGAEAVKKTLDEPDAILSPEELAEVAPILPKEASNDINFTRLRMNFAPARNAQMPSSVPSVAVTMHPYRCSNPNASPHIEHGSRNGRLHRRNRTFHVRAAHDDARQIP